MFLIDSLRSSLGKASPFALHIFLIFGVIFYTAWGALIIKYLESPERIKASRKGNGDINGTKIILSEMSGSELASLDPRVHECLLSSLVGIFSSVGCDDDSALDHTAISNIDDCYRSISIRGIDGIVVRDKEEMERIEQQKEEEEEEEVDKSKWSFENALIFSFTVITTIGYGHIVPETTLGRVFVILYGLIGVPLTLLTIADLGMFIAKALHLLLRGISKLCRWTINKYSMNARRASPIEEKIEKIVEGEEKGSGRIENEEESEEVHEPRKMDETLALCILFAFYLLIGAHVLSSYEPEMGFFEAFYFNFVTLTTIGLGDFVPKSTDYLFVTLMYIGVGLALTTMAVEIMADGLKKLHYFGRNIKSAATVFVWFGGEKMRLDRLIKNLGDQLNIPEEELLHFQVETFVEQAIKVEEGEIATLRRPVVMRPDRPFSYSNIRTSEESARLHFVDSTRSSKLGTVGLPPLAAETDRSARLESINRLRMRRFDENNDESGRKNNRVRFSQASFEGSMSTNSMNYSEEDLPTMRV